MLSRGLWLGLLAFVSACGIDIDAGQQLAGQRCFVPSDCATGLTCFERSCVPFGNDQTSENNANNGANNGENNTANNDPDVGVDSDVSPLCEVGTQRCLDERTAEVCVSEGGQGLLIQIECGRSETCRQGTCVGLFECTDNDNDGFGDGCDAGPDCNDQNPSVRPSVPENCQTAADDNCNGVANEGCTPDACCGNGCADSQFCSSTCECVDYDPAYCEYQNQPCFALETFDNGYYCADINESGVGRCYGLCGANSPDPNAQCPDPNSTCTFADDNGGICLSNCNLELGCGDPAFGCLPISSSAQDGVCVPVNNENQLGESCEPGETFDCASGLICVPRENGNGGVCRQACRPFAYPNGSTNTDCDQGHCIAFSPDIGICAPDNDATEGERCGPQLSACNEDAVGCYPSGGGNRCQKLCRLELGSIDCDPGRQCFQFSMDQPDLGVCVGMF